MAVIRNDAQITCLPAISVTPQAAAGKVKILAVSTARRSPYLPDVPTLKESGIDVQADAWNGLIAPGATPKPIIDKISKDVAEIIMQPGVQEKLAAQLMEPIGSSPEELRARMDSEIERWAPVIKAANVKVN
jgi:tripartite-type tricarboxylate transporter receptor subunit TctC